MTQLNSAQTTEQKLTGMNLQLEKVPNATNFTDQAYLDAIQSQFGIESPSDLKLVTVVALGKLISAEGSAIYLPPHVLHSAIEDLSKLGFKFTSASTKVVENSAQDTPDFFEIRKGVTNPLDRLYASAHEKAVQLNAHFYHFNDLASEVGTERSQGVHCYRIVEFPEKQSIPHNSLNTNFTPNT